MKSVLAIRHVHFEDLGVFEPLLMETGFLVRYSEAGIDRLGVEGTDTADLLVVLGAPIGAYEESKYPFLLDILRILERRMALRKPTLGVCLGAQLMARALGARVYPGSAKEIGWAKVSLTKDGGDGPLKHLQGVPVLHWHGDTFDLPAGATRLASTDLTPNQAFMVGEHSLAMQFHPEIDAHGFERWLIGHACEIGGVPGLSVTTLRDDTARYASASAKRARLLLSGWLDKCGIGGAQPKVNEKA